MRLVTWNINSVRARLARVEEFLAAYSPDVLCLQETKVQDHQFPLAFFEDLGYPHIAVRGEKSYNGVAIISKIPFKEVNKLNWCGRADARHISVTLSSGYEIQNFYVPAGGDEPKPDTNPKFAHKLQFMDEMRVWSKSLDGKQILVGDLNVAPFEEDVWDHKKLLKVVSHTPVEVEAMMAIIAAHGWVDVMREIVPLPEKLFSWWSYRARDWRASNYGRRLDHVWVSPDLKGKAMHMEVSLDARGGEKPSDHAPVIVDFDL